jgi:hypothetical protein
VRGKRSIERMHFSGREIEVAGGRILERMLLLRGLRDRKYGASLNQEREREPMCAAAPLRCERRKDLTAAALQ